MSQRSLYTIHTDAGKTTFEHESEALFKNVDWAVWVSRIRGSSYIPHPLLTHRYCQESLQPGTGQTGVSHL
jgi:hypothetical protein